MAKQTGYSFIEKKHSGNGIVSAVLGGGSLALLLALLLIAVLLEGRAAAWIGAFGFTGGAMAVCGLVYGFASFHDDCKYTFFSKFGTIVSTMAVAAWFFVACIGLAQGL